MVFTKYLWQVQCVCAKVNEAYNEQDIVTWGLNSFQFVLWNFFFLTQMIAVTDMWFGARITQVRPAEASGRTPESSSDQEWLCVIVQRASHADRHNFWESASAAVVVSCWYTNKVFYWMVNAPEIMPEIWIPLAMGGRVAVPFSQLFPEVPSQVRVSPVHLWGRSQLCRHWLVNVQRTSLYYLNALCTYIHYTNTLY